jgi:hypothetical protein
MTGWGAFAVSGSGDDRRAAARGRRARFADPLRLRRLGLALVAGGAVLAAVAAVLRGQGRPGTPGHSATYLLDVAAWFLAVAGAVVEARVGDRLLAVGQRGARQRAVLFSVGGLGAMLCACVTISLGSSGASGTPLRAALAAVMVGGLGVGLGGLATLGWFYGGRYAADRIQRMGEDDW